MPENYMRYSYIKSHNSYINNKNHISQNTKVYKIFVTSKTKSEKGQCLKRMKIPVI